MLNLYFLFYLFVLVKMYSGYKFPVSHKIIREPVQINSLICVALAAIFTVEVIICGGYCFE